MDILEKKIELLKKIINDSSYTVMLGGSGMMKEGGYQGLKSPEQAYETEKKYGLSPEDIFTTVFYNNRTEQFFDFYRTEILGNIPQITESAYVAARMEAAGKLQCIIDSNVYDLPQRGGCKHVISLHGSIYHNQCPHCGREYPMEYIRDCEKIPRCENCGRVIRPGVSLYGEMLDSSIMSEATRQVEQAEVLMLMGTSMESEVFSKYVRYFEGKKLVIIHKDEHFMDEKADLVILDEPKNILPRLGF